MTNYVSDKDLQVVKNGVTARFKAGVARPLRESLVEAAIGMGVRPADGKAPALPEKDIKPSLDQIAEAIKTIKARGRKEDVTASGDIRMKTLEAEVGYDVSVEDRDAAAALIEG
ncbi:hypothetical protein [Vreelandella massiliensis]|uniref:hypothetical protein n=1 Tax=Vreelandella massiliensis TaxID=1816686 RepID=UPI00096A39A9|nr:hypothetical protein [Halomonas massiliensis]